MKKIFALSLTLLFFISFKAICQAEDRALLIGIDTYKHRADGVSDTPGCVEDAMTISQLLKIKYNFRQESIRVLQNSEATSDRIKQVFQSWLIDGTKPGDRIFFLYSGHGSQVKDKNNDEQDGYDDTLFAYDGNPENGEKEILDDEIEVFIRQLSGRRAVLVFDSCHSGTISRGATIGGRFFPPPEEFKQLRGPASRGGDDKFIKGGVIGRGAGVRKVDGVDVSLSGIILITAAREDQEAFPIDVNGKQQGALTYVLSEILKSGQMSVKDLRNEISSRIKKLQQDRKLRGSQEPGIETQQSELLENYPLFGGWEQAAAAALVNPVSTIKVGVNTLQGKKSYKIGETISYQVTSSSPGYLYLIVFSQNNVATCLFPNSQDKDNKIESGALSIPRSKTYEFPIQEPIGRDLVVALVSTTPLNLEVKDVYNWDEIFERLKLKALQSALVGSKGQGVRIVEEHGYWQAGKIEVETVR
ncbi:MAG TPA: caspase family protein [Blastocatellia bacterium]|nr:caspase family protein [Blastocatellia bacterium]